MHDLSLKVTIWILHDRAAAFLHGDPLRLAQGNDLAALHLVPFAAHGRKSQGHSGATRVNLHAQGQRHNHGGRYAKQSFFAIGTGAYGDVFANGQTDVAGEGIVVIRSAPGRGIHKHPKHHCRRVVVED